MWTLEISWARKKKSAGRFFVSQKRRKPHLFLRLVHWKKNFKKLEFFFIKLISFSTCTIITNISFQNFLIKISENSLIISNWRCTNGNSNKSYQPDSLIFQKNEKIQGRPDFHFFFFLKKSHQSLSIYLLYYQTIRLCQYFRLPANDDCLPFFIINNEQ